jgi:hypothetical protein
MNSTIQPKGRVRLYAAGGCGLNIGSRLEEHRDRNETAFANLDIVYIDTSKSNLRKDIDQGHTYLIPDLDGSGKVRSENHAEISSHIRQILHKFKPADLNIVLSSAAGGSGSVIAPLLASELLGSDQPTVVIAIGSADTRLDAENTLKTLKSYESIAKLRKAPVSMMFVQNSRTVSRPQADAAAVATVMALCVLFSRENRELDSKDLFHWLHFEKTTSFPVKLTSLTLVENTTSIEGLGNIISVATLAKDGETTTLATLPEYQCVGYVPADADDAIISRSPMHFVISDGVLGGVASQLQTLLDEQNAAQEARGKNKALLDSADQPTDTGLVL